MTKDRSLTLFSFGYWGWGNSTPQLIEAIDALEHSRGFNPPLLVDIRISRSVRAPGFNNRALEILVGADRYLHIPDLGNRAVIENTGEQITIANPSAADTLLDLAISEQAKNRRLLFFCACKYQMEEGTPTCHRYEVGSLLLKAARKRNRQIVVTEWPGTEPQELDVSLPSEVLKKLRSGLKSVPLPKSKPLDHIAAIAWGSLVHCWSDGETLSLRVDRAMWHQGWYLPVIGGIDEHHEAASEREARAWGFFERRTGE
jgi:hypothetical protein